MASGESSRRPMSSEARSFDFGSDELLFSYDDYTQQKDQTTNAKRPDSTTKDLYDNRIGRPLANVYGQQEEIPREDALSAVEICMKKHADNLMRNLEEINGRLTQLELFCYKFERSVGEFRTDMIHGQNEADMKLKSLENHVHEVQRSVQIIRDKQDLADAHKELTKLHLSQAENVNSSLSRRNNEDLTATISDIKPQNDDKDMSNLQLTLALPNQISSSPPINAPDQNLSREELPAQDRYIQNHSTTYYTQPPPPRQYAPQRAQMQNLPHQPPFSQYQHQWPQPILPQQPSSSSSQGQVPRPQTPPTYPPYTPHQPSISESFRSSSMPPPAPYSSVPPQSIGYGVADGSIPHPPLFKSSHVGTYTYPPQSNMQAYNSAFAIDGSRASHPQNYQTDINTPSSQMMRNHPYGEMIEKAVNMGYSRDNVVNVVKRMGGAGQPLDFNGLLDELNMHANNGGPTRAWSR